MLSEIKRFAMIAGLASIGALVLIFTLQNSQQSRFQLLLWTTPELPFSVVLIATFLLGVIFSLLLSLALIWRVVRRSSREKREMRINPVASESN